MIIQDKGIQVFYIFQRNIFQNISNADFWQIAGIVALEKANAKLKSTFKLTFKGGRKDCTQSPETDDVHAYPNPNMNQKEMTDYFKKPEIGFGLNNKQVTTPIYTLHRLSGYY